MKSPTHSDTDSPLLDFPVPDRNRDVDQRTERLRQMVRVSGGPRAVATRSRVPLGTLNKYLAGRDMPAANLVRLANVCGYRVEWLATGQEPAPGRASETAARTSATAPVRLFNIVHIEKLAGAIEAVVDNFARHGLKPPMHQIVQAALLLYDMLSEPGFNPESPLPTPLPEQEDHD